MKVLSFGSLNIDFTYEVDHFVLPGETLSSISMMKNSGGKGLNQAMAIAKAGCEVYLAGCIGDDGRFILDELKENHVNGEYIKVVDIPTGNAIIQRDLTGQNCIILYPGANHAFTEEYIEEVFNQFDQGDIVLFQNEINNLNVAVDKAFDRGLQIALNPSPFNEKVLECDLSKVSYFFVNEIEGFQITNEKDPEKIMDKMLEMYPNANIILTLGGDGSMFGNKEERFYQPIYKVKAVDTTAAGDTFSGYVIYAIVNGMSMKEALDLASLASSITVTRVGSSKSVPTIDEVNQARQ